MADLSRAQIDGAIKMVNALGLKKPDEREAAMRQLLRNEYADTKDAQGISLVEKVMSDLASYPGWL